jgi:3-deoxy-D-manno-octulosonic acid kinase
MQPLGCRVNRELPGLGGGWRVCTPGGLVPEGEPATLEGAFGRGGVFRVGTWVLRPYRRGGLLRHFNERTYRSHLRFAAEYAVHRGLWDAGFPTVEPCGYAWRPVRFGVEGVLITRLAEGEAWPSNWQTGLDRAEEVRQVLQSLCDWGLWAPDLNATNFLFPSQGGVLMLDWDRAQFQPESANLWSRYRARLERSLRKLGAPLEAYEIMGAAPRP